MANQAADRNLQSDFVPHRETSSAAQSTMATGTITSRDGRAYCQYVVRRKRQTTLTDQRL